jgi:hypothetical protein
MLSALDGVLNDLEQTETSLDELSARMLAGAGVRYGKNSAEYEKAGGSFRLPVALLLFRNHNPRLRVGFSEGWRGCRFGGLADGLAFVGAGADR